MTPLLPILATCSLVSTPLWAQAPEQPATDLTANTAEDAFVSAQAFFQEATKEKNAAERKKMFATTIKKLQVYIQKFPKHKNTEAATYYLGSSFFQTGKNRQARIVFSDVIKKYKKGVYVANSANYLAYDAETSKKFKTAAAYYALVASQSTDLKSKEKGYYRQAVCYQKLKDTPKAESSYKTLVKLSDVKSKHYQKSQLALGHIAMAKKKYDSALAHFTTITSDVVESITRSEANFFQGVCLAQLKQLKQAEASYNVVLALPDKKWKPQAQVSILEARYASGDFRSVLHAHHSFGKLNDENLESKRLILAGQSHLKLREFTKAIEIFKKIEKAQPRSFSAFEANYRRILCYYNLKSNLVTNQVNQFILRYGRQFPKHRYMHTCLMLQAETLFDNGSFTAAAKVYEQIDGKLIAKANQPSVLYKKAWSYSELKNHRKAIKLFSTYLKAYPKDPRTAQILAVRAKSYHAIGNDASAMKDYDKVIKMAPKTQLSALALQASARIQKEHKKLSDMVVRYEKLLDSAKDLEPTVKLNAHYWAAWGHFKAKNYKKAIPHLNAANKIDKGAYKKQLSLVSVLCHFNLKNKDECVKAAKKANLTGIANDIPMGIYRWLGIQCYKSNQLADAQLFLSLGVTKLAPGDTPVYYWSLLAKCQYKNQHYKWALQSLTHALIFEKNEAQKVNLMLYKALCQNGENQPELSKATAIEALKKNPTGKTKAMLLQLLGDLHFKSQNYKEAAICYASITEFYEDKEILPYSIAMIIKTLHTSGKKVDAKVFEERLKKEFPKYKLPK